MTLARHVDPCRVPDGGLRGDVQVSAAEAGPGIAITARALRSPTVIGAYMLRPGARIFER